MLYGICFTYNNYTEADIIRIQGCIGQRGISYICYGREVGEQGTPHLQGYLQSTMKNFQRLQQAIGHCAMSQAKAESFYYVHQGILGNPSWITYGLDPRCKRPTGGLWTVQLEAIYIPSAIWIELYTCSSLQQASARFQVRMLDCGHTSNLIAIRPGPAPARAPTPARTLPRRASASGASTPPLLTPTSHLPNPRTRTLNFLRHPLGSPNTKSLNQGAAVFSARLMYSRKSWCSANPPVTGAHVASRHYQIIACTILCLH